jgi:hypothetical protein
MNVIHMHTANKQRANGAGVAVAIAANRYGHSPQQSAAFANTARELVARGCSPARAIAAVKRVARSVRA